MNAKLQAGLDSLIERIEEWAALGHPMPDEVASATLTEIFQKAGVTADDTDHIQMQKTARSRVADALNRAKRRRG
jgi:hypothetical protein